MEASQIAEAALGLPHAERASLAEKLLASLDHEPDDAIEKKWIEIALRRRDEVREGKVKPIPGEEALAQARRALKQ